MKPRPLPLVVLTQRRWRAVFIAAVVIFIITLLQGPSISLKTWQQSKTPVHFILPIDKPNDPFCKSLFTALVNDFQPTLVNFHSEKAAIAKTADDKKKLKVEGVLDYVSMNVTDPDDIVIMADSMDVQWQVSVDELVQRYVSPPVPLFVSILNSWYLR